MLNPLKIFPALLLLVFVEGAFASGTSIGNGGDPIFHFLESTRHSLRQVMRDLALGQVGPDICAQIEHLTPQQKRDCSQFSNAIIEPLVDLNAPVAPVEFVLRDQPLYVEGPDQKPMPVAARTQLGPEGVVEFYRAAIEPMSPTQLLFLIAHELAHKVEFEGDWVEDNSPIMSFSSGRVLLDAFAKAIVNLAVKRGHIGTEFGLRDSFECRIESSAGRLSLRVSSGRRIFSEDYDRYEVSLGHLPSDPHVEVPGLKDTYLRLRLKVVEDQGCREPSSQRHTRLEIERHDPYGYRQEPDIIAQADFVGFNPICEQKSTWLAVRAEGTLFRCRYRSTEGESLY